MKYLVSIALSLFISADAFAMAGQQADGKQGGLMGMMLPMVVIFAIFYLLLIRPQQKQQKKVKAMLASIQKGDDVITSGGIHGKIEGLADDVVTLLIAPNVKIKINRGYIGAVVGKETQTAK